MMTPHVAESISKNKESSLVVPFKQKPDQFSSSGLSVTARQISPDTEVDYQPNDARRNWADTDFT